MANAAGRAAVRPLVRTGFRTDEGMFGAFTRIEADDYCPLYDYLRSKLDDEGKRALYLMDACVGVRLSDAQDELQLGALAADIHALKEKVGQLVKVVGKLEK
jgi:hypothetical protein